MESLSDREIKKASDAIDKAFAVMTRENRGETAQRILSFVRNLNDNIAEKVWCDIHPEQPMSVNKVASKLTSGQYRFISHFDKFMRFSLAHFTPSEDGAERLLLKYYKYLLQLKKLMNDRYGVTILKNIGCFIEDTDEQTKDYYTKVANSINTLPSEIKGTDYDNYYIDKVKPFYINNDIYYEITLEPATKKPNKFLRITAFTHCDIFSNYSVALSFVDAKINVFHTAYPIKIIVNWKVSIRPCEIDNFAWLIGIKADTRRSNSDYKNMMEILTRTHLPLNEIIELPDNEYKAIKAEILGGGLITSSIADILDKSRTVCLRGKPGNNIIRYLLYKMNNVILKHQYPTLHQPKTYDEYNMSSKCLPFDLQPFAFNPKDHVPSTYDLFQCIDPSGHKAELLKRHLDNNTYSNHILFTPISDLTSFGEHDEIINLVREYNGSLYDRFRPNSEIGIYKEHLYIQEYEIGINKIIDALQLISRQSANISDRFSIAKVEVLETLPESERLDDPLKKSILTGMFSNSKVHCVYGAAGTGKTTLINHISQLLIDKKRIFLAKTHPAIENLRRKVKCKNSSDEFITIDQFIKSGVYDFLSYDLIVVDECSTVKNQDMLNILNRLGDAALVLMGDTYQIEAIGYGNWFSIIKYLLPSNCCHELTTPYRSTDISLQNMWNEVRNMSDTNISLEHIVRNDYSHIIDNDIFERKSEDEIILCLNYNGLFGLNNINKLLQLSNPHPAISIGIWQFKIDDPILFNDSDRFSCLYNNLKGKIIDIIDKEESVYFSIEVEIPLDKNDIEREDNLDFIFCDGKRTRIGFSVNRRKPYSSDSEEITNYHIIPFQIAYAVSIHKSQGLEFDSVKIVIADETEDKITHNIFYTAITRARTHLTIYWSPEVCDRILARIRPAENNKDFFLLQSKREKR